MDSIEDAVADLLAKTIGAPIQIEGMEPLSGGSINEVRLVQTDRGPFVVKWNRHPLDDQFAREAEGLNALRQSGTTLRIPEAIASSKPHGRSPALLILEYIRPARRCGNFDALLGAGLAQLHRATADGFGFANDNYCGATPQPNGWQTDWPTFYRVQRLEFQIERAARTRRWSSSDRGIFDRLLSRLDDHLGIDPEPPALIHGDLWSGNLHVDENGEPGLIDPAAYYGHREAELGMMVLFGGFSRRVFESYREAYPLQPGWEGRLDLYTLYHVLNHYNLFGGGYGSQAIAIAKRYL